MKKYIVMQVMLCLFANVCFCIEDVKDAKDRITLESPLLDLIDGKSFGIEEITFGLLLRQRLEIRRRIYGIAQKDGQRIGYFEFEGKKVSLLDLCKLEKQVEADSNDFRKNALQDLLSFAKEDFIGVTGKYANDVREIKSILIGLMEEFLQKKGVEDSFLLTWGALAPHEEEDNIRKCLTTFKDFTAFCIDLVGFLEAMANSCPKGKALFVDMIKKARQGT